MCRADYAASDVTFTGRGDFDICIPLDLFKQEIQKMQISNNPMIAEAFEFLREAQEFAAKLGAG